jgi:hypothetical protein
VLVVTAATRTPNDKCRAIPATLFSKAISSSHAKPDCLCTVVILAFKIN